VTRQVKELSNSYKNPFDPIIKGAINDMIAKEVESTYRPKIEEGVKAALAAHMTEDVISNIIKASIEKLNRSNY
jgi:hypothetical protein